MRTHTNKFVRISGHNGSTGGGTSIVFNSTYESNGMVFDTPGLLQVSSSSANDTAAGTGARTVIIEGFDVDGAVIEEILALNGQTAVATTKEFDAISSVRVVTAGSGDSNAGNIFLSPVGTNTTAGVPDGNTKITIVEVGQGIANQFFFKVPKHHVAHVRSGAAGTDGLEHRVVVMRPDEAWNTVIRVPNNTGIDAVGNLPAGTIIMSQYVDAGSANVIYTTLDITVMSN